MPVAAWRFVALMLAASGCGTTPPALSVVNDVPSDTPIAAASADLIARFRDGDRLFGVPFREPDGLGPLYIRDACSSCHASAGRGPGAVQKMAIVLDDGVTPGDQGALAFGHTVRPQMAAGAKTPIAPPADPHLKLSTRAAPPVLGRGYMEAIDDAEILRVEAEQAARGDAIHGHANRVTYTSQPNPDTRFHQHQPGQAGILGRFGLKSRIATLDDFAADAAQGDMGITSTLRPTELANPDGLTDDKHPGPDIDADIVNGLAFYMRLLAIPDRGTPDAAGARLFADTLCAVCHVPSLKTRADYPLAPLAGVDAPVYTDLLLHDMGAALADGLTDGESTSRQWRTAPLIGVRLVRDLLHDGRVSTIADAIEAHGASGSEAADSVARYHALGDAQKKALIDFVSSL